MERKSTPKFWVQLANPNIGGTRAHSVKFMNREDLLPGRKLEKGMVETPMHGRAVTEVVSRDIPEAGEDGAQEATKEATTDEQAAETPSSPHKLWQIFSFMKTGMSVDPQVIRRQAIELDCRNLFGRFAGYHQVGFTAARVAGVSSDIYKRWGIFPEEKVSAHLMIFLCLFLFPVLVLFLFLLLFLVLLKTPLRTAC